MHAKPLSRDLLWQVLCHCAQAYWHSLDTLEPIGDDDAETGEGMNALFTLALFIQYQARVRLARLRNSPEPPTWTLPIAAMSRFLVEVAFLHLRLAEQELLIDANDSESRDCVVQHCHLFLHSLLAAALSSDGPALRREQEEMLFSMGRYLPSRLSSQLQLRLAVSKGCLADRFVLVLGMHRSGTSALTGMLSQAGLDAPVDMNAPDLINPRGYWESVGLNTLNNEMFTSLGCDWSNPSLPEGWQDSEEAQQWRRNLLAHLQIAFGSAKAPVLKDPRLCVLMPGLLPWLECGCVRWLILLPLRHPLEVAQSLEAVQDVPMPQGILLWLQYVLSAERFSRNHVRRILSFEDLINNPTRILEQILLLLDPGTLKPDHGEAASFVTAELYRQRRQDLATILRERTSVVATSRNLAIRLYELMLSEEETDPRTTRWLDSLMQLCPPFPARKLAGGTARAE